jgi:hypothetical protein
MCTVVIVGCKVSITNSMPLNPTTLRGPLHNIMTWVIAPGRIMQWLCADLLDVRDIIIPLRAYSPRGKDPAVSL